MTTLTLSTLIDDVEARAQSPEPLDLLATASATVQEVTDLTDALLSHFVDRCRRAGHSWAEIGQSLGVTKQAVQKRFTPGEDLRSPRGWERFTDRCQKILTTLAPAASEELGHNYIGTEHLLLAMLADPDSLAAKVLAAKGVTRDATVDAVDAHVPRGHQGLGGITSRAWVTLEKSVGEALRLGHNYVGTEHVLLSLLRQKGSVAETVLTELGVTAGDVEQDVLARLRQIRGG